jgi:hypothetical protein
MKKITPIRLLFCAIVLIAPVPVWNILFLDYIDQNGKLLPWLLAGPVAYLSTGILQGFKDGVKPVTVKGEFNPFWGWFAVALVIEIVFVVLSNT